MKTLTERRDEMAEKFADSMYDKQGDIYQQMPWTDCAEGFKLGFDACKEEMMKDVQGLVKALDLIGRSRTLDGEDTASAKYARKTLKDFEEKMK